MSGLHITLRALLTALCFGLTAGQCPTNQCSCSSEAQGLTLYCSGEGLSEVPEFEDTGLKFYEVTLADNSIRGLGAGAFTTASGKGLVTEVLDLSGNPLTFIHQQSFQGLSDSLRVLILHTEGMTEFPTAAIQSLGGLTRLALQGFSLTGLPGGALSALTNLQVLSMEGCGLQSLRAEDFTGQVSSLTELHLPSNRFTSVPSSALSALSRLRVLDVSSNLIESLGADTFSGLGAVELLNLESNGVRSISVQAFRGATDTLRELHLGNNRDSLVAGDLVAVRDCDQLEVLDLSYNTLSSLPTNFFQNMGKLRTFSMQRNELTALTLALVGSLGSSIRELNLMENEIRGIEQGVFEGLGGLQVLRLDRNPLGPALNPSSLQGLENSLLQLHLMDTAFTHDHWDSLTPLHALQTLDLEQNSIASVPPDTFLPIPRLSTLNLRNNQLSSLSQRSFRGLQDSLTRIILTDNNIQTLGHCTFHRFNLMEIGLRNNPLLCDCQAVWLRQWIDAHNPSTNLWQCDSPSKHARKYLKNIPEVDLTCDVPPSDVVCEEFTTSTTPAPGVTSEGQTPGPAFPLHLNVTGVGGDWLRLLWQVYSAEGVEGWGVSCSTLETGELVYSEEHGLATRTVQIGGLQASTEYFVCVTPRGDSGLQQACINEMTGPGAGAVFTPTQRTLLILGCVFGVVLVIAIVIAIACFLRWRNKNAHPKFKPPTAESQSNPELPTVSDQSKRFSKAKSHSLGNLTDTSDRRLEGFSPYERDRILKLLSSQGASTMSMLSTGSHRYTHDPLGNGRPGYLNPMQVSQELGRQDSGEYQEIPADTYDEIPMQDTHLHDMYNQIDDRPKSTGDILGGASNYI